MITLCPGWYSTQYRAWDPLPIALFSSILKRQKIFFRKRPKPCARSPALAPAPRDLSLPIGTGHWARDQVARAKDLDIQICVLTDPLYPEILSQIYAPPPLLFAKGDISHCHRPTISIVGSRSFTAYGRETAHRLGSELARAGITVVSGMAVGIDTHAHRGSTRTRRNSSRAWQRPGLPLST